ncbi:MAG: hypothetical protein M1383_03430 [Patescibacteria group bacterium]|nr:hypothetical protein [Patescibacteria group bacterium]
MDVFAHALWTNAAFYDKYRTEKRRRFVAVLFGLLPDLSVFIPLSAYLIFHPAAIHRHLEGINSWTYGFAVYGYNYTHSLAVFAAVLLVVLALRRGKMYWPMWGWPLHIFLDVFTHKVHFSTPIFYPLSNFHNPYAVSWADTVPMIVNYGLLAIIYIIWFFFFRKRYGLKKVA